jgi:hypothetical protein
VELRGGDFEVGGEDSAEGTAAEDIKIAEVVVVEAIGAGELVGGEEVGVVLGDGIGGYWLEGYDPEVECLGRLRASGSGFGGLVRIIVGGQEVS